MGNIAIIPARGGSKRIPRKNIKKFCGKPIIAYSIKAALESGIFSEVMVSTDDEEIASIARDYGASVPFLRSVENSSDYASTIDVLLEVVEYYSQSGMLFENVCCLYPTAPFVTAKKLIAAYKICLNNNESEIVLPVVQYSFPVQRAIKIIAGHAEMISPENYFARSQDLEPVYHDAGQFYFIKSKILANDLVLFCEKAYPLVVPEIEVQDIDNQQDWLIAEIKYNYMIKNSIEEI